MEHNKIVDHRVNYFFQLEEKQMNDYNVVKLSSRFKYFFCSS